MRYKICFNDGDYGWRDKEHQKWDLKQKLCECGAIHTSNPTIHAEWCPAYVKDKFESDSYRRKGNGTGFNNCK